MRTPKKTEATEATGRIKVIKVPEGEAPPHVRKARVGLELPCFPESGFLPWAERGRGALTLVQTEGNYRIVIVPQKEALKILSEKNTAAAAWWYDHGFPKTNLNNPYFLFKEDEVEIISGVRQMPIRPFVPEDEEGQVGCVLCGKKIGPLARD